MEILTKVNRKLLKKFESQEYNQLSYSFQYIMSDAAEKMQQQPPQKKMKLNEEIAETVEMLAKLATKADGEKMDSSESLLTDPSMESGSGGSSEIDEGTNCVTYTLFGELCPKCAKKCLVGSKNCKSCKGVDRYTLVGSKYCKSCF